jgi:hypothetical protein
MSAVRPFALAAALAAAGLVASCSEPSVCSDGNTACLSIRLVTASCSGDPSPVENVSKLRVAMVPPGAGTPLVQEVSYASGQAEIPALQPAGKGWQLRVDALSLDGTVTARGASSLLEIDLAEKMPTVKVFLRPIDRFSRPVSEGSTLCGLLGEPRSGHTATLLKDGRVLLAGGYVWTGPAGSQTKRLLDTLELYDPQTGRFSTLGARLDKARTGHTATLLNDGRVLIAGGLIDQAGAETPAALAQLFDPATGTLAPVLMKKPRAHHAAVLLPGGKVLMCGGLVSDPRYPSDSCALFDADNPDGIKDQPLTLSARRRDPAAVMLDSERAIFIGGHDGNAALDTYDIVEFRTELVRSASPGKLAMARGLPVALPFGIDGRRGVFVGGLSETGNAGADLGWEWIVAEAGSSLTIDKSVASVERRTGACAASSEGKLLFAGGRLPGESGAAVNFAEKLGIDANGAVSRESTPVLAGRARWGATCTTLQDGTVLVVGGETRNGPNFVSSDDAELYQP